MAYALPTQWGRVMLQTGVFRQVAHHERADHGRKQGQAAAFVSLAWALAIALTALIVTNAFPARADNGITEQQARDERRAVSRAAFVAEIKSSPYGLDSLVQISAATDAMKQGRPAQEVSDRARDASRQFNALRRGTPGDREGNQGFIAPIGKMLGGLALSPMAPGPGAALGLAGLAEFSERFTGYVVDRQTRREAKNVTLNKAVESYVDEYLQYYDSQPMDRRRALYGSLRNTLPGIDPGILRGMDPDLSPSESADAFINASPALARHQDLLTRMRDSEISLDTKIDEARDAIASTMEETRESLRQDIQIMADRLEDRASIRSSQLDGLQEFLQQEQIERINRQQQQAEHIRQQQADQIKVEGLRAAGYVLTTVVGIADEEAGKNLSAVVNFTFDLYDAVDTFEKVSGEFGGLTSFAAAALTGDFLSAGLKLVSAFIDTGPTADEMILEEVGKLREQVESVRREMHGRFDHVDARLAAIHQDLREGMWKLEELLRSGNRDILRALSTIREGLENHERSMQGILHAVLGQAERIIVRQDAHALERCSQLRYTTDTDGIEERQFADCLAGFHAIATTDAFETDQMDVGMFLELSEGRRDLANSSDRLSNAAFQGFKNLSSDASLPASVVGPMAWFSLADRTDRFMLDWKHYAAPLVNIDTPYRLKMRLFRENLRAWMHELESDYQNFRNGRGSAIGSLLDGLRKGVRVLAWREHVREEPVSNEWPGEEKEYIRSQQRMDEYENLVNYVRERFPGREDRIDYVPYRFDYEDEKAGDYLLEKTRIRRCIPRGSARDEAQEEGECRRDGMPLDKIHSSWGEREDDVKSEIWEAFVQGFERNYVLSRMGAANLIDGIEIYSGGVFGGDSADQEDWDTGDGRLDYEYRREVEINVVVRASCFVDGYYHYRGRRGDDLDFDVYINRIFDFLERESMNWRASRWRDQFYLENDRQRLIRIDPEPGLRDLDDYYKKALRDLRRDVRDDHGEGEDCGEEVENRMKLAYRHLSNKMYERMEDDPDFQSYRRRAEEYSVYLQSWLSIMLRDMTGRSRIAEAVVAGEWVLPTVDQVWKQVQDEDGYVWNLRNRYTDVLDEFEEALRSPLFENVMNEGAGDVDLMQTLFLGIDDVDPVGSASPTPVTVRGE